MPLSTKPSAILSTVLGGTRASLNNPSAEIARLLQFHGIKTSLGAVLFHLLPNLVALADRKQQDYGSDNLTEFGEFGILVRLSDKRGRLKTLVGSGAQPKVADEGIGDTWLDLANYALIGYCMHTGLWRGAGTATVQFGPPLPENFEIKITREDLDRLPPTEFREALDTRSAQAQPDVELRQLRAWRERAEKANAEMALKLQGAELAAQTLQANLDLKQREVNELYTRLRVIDTKLGESTTPSWDFANRQEIVGLLGLGNVHMSWSGILPQIKEKMHELAETRKTCHERAVQLTEFQKEVAQLLVDKRELSEKVDFLLQLNGKMERDFRAKGISAEGKVTDFQARRLFDFDELDSWDPPLQKATKLFIETVKDSHGKVAMLLDGKDISIPQLGAEYQHRRVPYRVVPIALCVTSNGGDPTCTDASVLMLHIDDDSELGRCLRVEPLSWYVQHYGPVQTFAPVDPVPPPAFPGENPEAEEEEPLDPDDARIFRGVDDDLPPELRS